MHVNVVRNCERSYSVFECKIESLLQDLNALQTDANRDNIKEWKYTELFSIFVIPMSKFSNLASGLFNQHRMVLNVMYAANIVVKVECSNLSALDKVALFVLYVWHRPAFC